MKKIKFFTSITSLGILSSGVSLFTTGCNEKLDTIFSSTVSSNVDLIEVEGGSTVEGKINFAVVFKDAKGKEIKSDTIDWKGGPTYTDNDGKPVDLKTQGIIAEFNDLNGQLSINAINALSPEYSFKVNVRAASPFAEMKDENIGSCTVQVKIIAGDSKLTTGAIKCITKDIVNSINVTFGSDTEQVVEFENDFFDQFKEPWVDQDGKPKEPTTWLDPIFTPDVSEIEQYGFSIEWSKEEDENENKSKLIIKASSEYEKELTTNQTLKVTLKADGTNKKLINLAKFEFNINFVTQNKIIIGDETILLNDNFDINELSNTAETVSLTKQDGNKETFYKYQIKNLYLTNIKHTTVIPDNFLNSFTSLEEYNCMALNNASYIGNSFLSGCNNLKTIILKDLTNVTYVGENFLYGCTAITTIDLTALNKISVINDGFLRHTEKLKQVDISSFVNLTSIGDHFVSHQEDDIFTEVDPQLEKVILPNFGENKSKLIQIGNYFLDNASNLSGLENLEKATTLSIIGDSFLRNTKITNVNLSTLKNLSIIKDNFCAYCYSMTRLDAPYTKDVPAAGQYFLYGDETLWIENVTIHCGSQENVDAYKKISPWKDHNLAI